jgi:hypothetical protein
MALTRDALFTAGARGGLQVISPADGSVVALSEFPAPVWDGPAAAEGQAQGGVVTPQGRWYN